MHAPVVDVVLHELGVERLEDLPRVVAVVEDAQLEFARALAALPGGGGADATPSIRVFSDVGVDAAAREVFAYPALTSVADLDGELFAAAELVIGMLPKSLAELDEIAELVAAKAAPGVTLMLSGREKHLNRSMNEQLASHFENVSATRGLRKARALVGRGPKPVGQLSYPREARIPDLDLTVAAHGAAFAGTGYDIGTRALIESLDVDDLTAERAVDLGCGTGILAAWLARQLPDAEVIATDRSWAACASAAATAAANGLEARIRVLRGNAGEGIDDASCDLVLLNPPFHDGHEVQQGMANELFRAAARILRPGGTLVTVFNSHLRHREHLERIVGPTRQLARTSKFTVMATTR